MLRATLPEVISDLSRAYPEVSIRVRGGYDEQLLTMLDRGEVAFVLTETSRNRMRSDLEQEPLIDCEYVVAGRRRHPLAGNRKVKLSQLLNYPWAMPDQAVSALDRLRGLYLATSLPAPEPVIRSTSLNFILKLLASSDALSFVVRSSLDDARQDGIVSIPVESEMPVRSAGIVKKKGSWNSPVVMQLAAMLRKSCQANPVQ